MITELAESAASGDAIMSIATENGSPTLDMACWRSSVTRTPLRKPSWMGNDGNRVRAVESAESDCR